jgi:cardiolipin synthase (CMP-forming)
MLRQLKSTPNLLTLLRLIFIPFIAMMVMDGYFGWALCLFVLAGVSDGLDGFLARRMDQRTTLGQYLDPIADKLLLSTMFLVLALTHKMPWKITILVFSRDFGILLISGLLFMTTSLRDFTPSFFGKANTVAQICTVLLVMLDELMDARWLTALKQVGMWTTFALTLISWIHYTIIVGQRLRSASGGRSAAA